MMNRQSWLILLSLPLLLAACNPQAGGDAPEQDSATPLTGLDIGGDFDLLNQDGERTSSQDLAGQYRIIYFGYTYCPDVCPIDLQKVMKGLALAEKEDPALADKVQPIFISVDPERDRPEVLKRYVAAFHPRLIGLTGTDEESAAVAKKYLVIYDRGDEGGNDYLVDHSRQAYLFGPKGEPVALLPYDADIETIASEIARWVS